MFQVSGRLDGNKVSGGNVWGVSWSSRAARPSRPVRWLRGSSKCDVEYVSDVLWVLGLIAWV